MALHSLYCADVPLRNCSLTHVAHVRLNQALLLQQHSSTAVTRGVDTLRRSFSSRQGVMRAGCGGRDVYLRLQPLYLGPLTAVNNLATGLNWPTVVA